MSYVSTDLLFSTLEFGPALDTILWNLPERLRFLFAAVMSEYTTLDTSPSVYLSALMDPYCCLMARFYKQTPETKLQMVRFLREHGYDHLRDGALIESARFAKFTDRERIKLLFGEFGKVRAQLRAYWNTLAQQNKVITKTFACLLRIAKVTQLFRAKQNRLQNLYERIILPALADPTLTWNHILVPTTSALPSVCDPLDLELLPLVVRKRKEAPGVLLSESAPKRAKYSPLIVTFRNAELIEIELLTSPDTPVS